MDEAAPQAAGGMTDGERAMAAVGDALVALRLKWGRLYLAGHDEKGYWAARHVAPGTGLHRADTPEELDSKLTAAEAGPS